MVAAGVEEKMDLANFTKRVSWGLATDQMQEDLNLKVPRSRS